VSGRRPYGPTPPVKDCDHAYGMKYLSDRCWCKHCGQTWKMRTDDEGKPRGWWPIALHKASHGESVW